MCLRVAKEAKNTGHAQHLAVIYDEMARKHMTEMAEKNDPDLELNGKNIGKSTNSF